MLDLLTYQEICIHTHRKKSNNTTQQININDNFYTRL